jgi:phosphoribosylformylglycinamidine cyclo-ligase
MLPDGVTAVIQKNSYPIPPIFDCIKEQGGIEEEMMYNTFNMGIGMLLAVDPSDVKTVLRAVTEANETAYEVGSIQNTPGKAAVVLQ